MEMNKSILCTIDFSDSSKDVLKYAVALAKQQNNDITILYAYRLLNSHNGEVVDMRKKIEENARLNFALLEKEILANSGVSYSFKIEVGFVANRVKEFTKKNGVSFLVMGKKMNSANEDSFDELSNNIHVPLVIVP